MGKNEFVRKSKEERCDRRKMELTSEKLKRSDCVLQKKGGKRGKREVVNNARTSSDFIRRVQKNGNQIQWSLHTDR